MNADALKVTYATVHECMYVRIHVCVCMLVIHVNVQICIWTCICAHSDKIMVRGEIRLHLRRETNKLSRKTTPNLAALNSRVSEFTLISKQTLASQWPS